jgi:mono/diheme cytochrome c family protein
MPTTLPGAMKFLSPDSGAAKRAVRNAGEKMKLRMTSIAIAFGLFGIAAGVPVVADENKEAALTPEAMIEKIKVLEADTDAVENGRQLYGNTCLFCHGPKGVGARAPNLVEGMFKPGRDGEVPFAYGVLMNGRPGTIMGSYKEILSQEEIWNVMAYLRSEGTRVLEERKQRLKKR